MADEKGERKTRRKSSGPRFLVRVFKARDLRPLAGNVRPDAFVKLSIGSLSTQRSRVIKEDFNPVWNQEFQFDSWPKTEKLTLSVWHWRKFSQSEFLGEIVLDYPIHESGVDRYSMPLKRNERRSKKHVSGTIELEAINIKKKAKFDKRQKSSEILEELEEEESSERTPLTKEEIDDQSVPEPIYLEKDLPMIFSHQISRPRRQLEYQVSHVFTPHDISYPGPHTTQLRHHFFSRMFGFLSVEVFLMLIATIVFLNSPFLLELGSRHTLTLVLFLSTPAFLLWVFLFVLKSRYPSNFLILMLFTLFAALALGSLSAVLVQGRFHTITPWEDEASHKQILKHERGLAYSITYSLFILFTLFLGLALLSLQRSVQISFGRASVYAFAWVGLIWLYLEVFFTAPISSLVAMPVTALISQYLILDAYLMTQKYGYGDLIIAVIELHLDIVSLFIFVVYYLFTCGKRIDANLEPSSPFHKRSIGVEDFTERRDLDSPTSMENNRTSPVASTV